MLIKEHPLEVWRIDGMRFSMSDHDPERSLTLANRIEPGVAQLQLILDGEDIYEVWTLDSQTRRRASRYGIVMGVDGRRVEQALAFSSSGRPRKFVRSGSRGDGWKRAGGMCCPLLR